MGELIIKDLPNIFRDFTISLALKAYSKHSGRQILRESWRLRAAVSGGVNIGQIRRNKRSIEERLPPLTFGSGRRCPTKPI
jgi:hypothetical protein